MGQKNLAVLETYLKDIILTEVEIIEKVEDQKNIFEIKDALVSLGFIYLYDLKAYVLEHEEEAINYWVRNYTSEDWVSVFEHPLFQRRKPQIISQENFQNDDQEFYILHKGQKHGPYNKNKLLTLVEDKELLLTDMVSFNAGHTWIKLFQIDGFDRRTLKESEHLPDMPSNEIMNKSIEIHNSVGETTDAFTSLAYLGNLKKGNAIDRDHQSILKNELAQKAHSTSFYKWMMIFSIVGIIYFLMNIKSNLSSPFKENDGQNVGEQAEMLSPVENEETLPFQGNNKSYQKGGINDQQRGAKFNNRTLTPVRPASRKKSFMDTQSFLDVNNQYINPTNDRPEDSTYYYDNAQPMELDPVRAQISKENFSDEGISAPAPPVETLFNQEVSD